MIKIFLLLLIIVTVIGIPVFWVYGVYISFVANPITGVLVLILEPAPFVVGVANAIWNYNIAEVFTEKFIR